MRMPTQVNSDDCGVYVLAATEYIVMHGIQANVKDALTPDAIVKKRVTLSALMQRLAQRERAH